MNRDRFSNEKAAVAWTTIFTTRNNKSICYDTSVLVCEFLSIGWMRQEKSKSFTQ